MFEKIVTNALISPNLLGEVHIYAKKQQRVMKKRLIIAVLSFIFLLTQLVGAFASQNILSESAKGSLDSYGIYSKQALLNRYKAEQSSIRDVANGLLIAQDELENTSDNFTPIDAAPLVEWSLSPTFVSMLTKNDTIAPLFIIKTPTGKVYYGHPTSLTQGKDPEMLYGYSRNAGHFAIIKQTGNILSSRAAALKADICSKKDTSTACARNNSVRNSIIVNNLTYKTEAKFIKIHPGDQLMYSLGIYNSASEPVKVAPEIYLGDILEYAQLTDKEGGYLHQSTDILAWPKTTIPAQQNKFYNFKVKIFETIPLVAQSNVNRSSYDCQISTFFGTTYSLKIACPIQKVAERLINTAFSPLLALVAGVLFCINLFLYVRSYVIHKELSVFLRLHRGKFR